MNLENFLRDPEWDAPFFKVLAANDTGTAPGHQGGVVIPKPLRQYFPDLNPETVSRETPTVDRRLWVELWDGERPLGTVNSRYQFQTWGGTRSPESRLTDNLGELRNIAHVGDILIMQRHALEITHYRLCLIRKRSSVGFAKIVGIVGTSRWGVIDETPVTDETIKEATEELVSSEKSQFHIFDQSPTVIETRSKQLSRTIAFRKKLFNLYEGNCAVCQSSLRTPSHKSEMEAAHVVPRNRGGVNDARNGLGLCRRHHWAFDRGFFGIEATRKIFVPDATLEIPQNEPLRAFHGKPLLEANNRDLLTHPDALKWHFENTMIGNI